MTFGAKTDKDSPNAHIISYLHPAKHGVFSSFIMTPVSNWALLNTLRYFAKIGKAPMYSIAFMPFYAIIIGYIYPLSRFLGSLSSFQLYESFSNMVTEWPYLLNPIAVMIPDGP